MIDNILLIFKNWILLNLQRKPEIETEMGIKKMMYFKAQTV